MEKIFYFCVLAALVPFSSNLGDDEAATDNAKMRSELYKTIFRDYDKLNIPDNPDVRFGLALRNIYVESSDDLLKWNSKSTGVDVLRIGSEEVWKPDMTLYNSANPGKMVSCEKSMALIYPNGEVLRVPPCHISVYCNMTLEVHPWGEQTCKFKFGSWVYDSFVGFGEIYFTKCNSIDDSIIVGKTV